MNYSEQILKARFEQLPEDVRSAITATPWNEKLKQISDKHNLHIDQAGHLGEETAIVMFGLDHTDNLVANIAKHVEVSEEKAEAIAEDLNREIFLKVRESLKKIFEERDERAGGSFLAGSLLGKTEEKESETETDETLKREDILREIEDKEHHNLPAVNKQELHLEARPPSEISAQVSFQNQKMADSAKRDKPAEMIVIRPEQPQRQPAMPQGEAMKTMKGDIFKNKMSGTVNMPRETIEINDAKTPAKKLPSDVGNKIDPYREKIGK